MNIDGLPKGFEIKEVRLIECESNDNDQRIYGAQVIVKKKQPRRIVLEETEEESHLYESGKYASYSAGEFVLCGTKNKWRIVNENDSPLHNDDDKESLRLSVDECKAIITGNVYANPIIIDKLRNFIKDSK